MENFGVIYALGAAVFWGSFFVPFKKSKTDNNILYQVLMSVGILFSGLIYSLFLGYSFEFNIYGFITGTLWALANSASLVAVTNLGLSRATPLVVSLVTVTSFLVGIAFGELSSGILTGAIGIIVIIIGILVTNVSHSVATKNIKVGLLAAAFSGVVLGNQFIPIKIAGALPHDYFFSMSLGIFACALVLYLLKRPKFEKNILIPSLFSGILWNTGNLLGVLAISLIGLSKGIPITQSALLVAVLWGLFYFKEITGRKQRLQILIGAVILMVGIIILGAA